MASQADPEPSVLERLTGVQGALLTLLMTKLQATGVTRLKGAVQDAETIGTQVLTLALCLRCCT